MKRISACVIFLMCSLGVVKADSIDGDISLPGLFLTFSAEADAGHVRGAGYLVTDNSIESNVAVFYTETDHSQWHTQWIVSGIVEKKSLVQDVHYSSSILTNELCYQAQWGTFSYPYKTNQSFWNMTLQPAYMVTGQCFYSEEAIEDEPGHFAYTASVEISGILPEPNLVILLGALVVLKRK